MREHASREAKVSALLEKKRRGKLIYKKKALEILCKGNLKSDLTLVFLFSVIEHKIVLCELNIIALSLNAAKTRSAATFTSYKFVSTKAESLPNRDTVDASAQILLQHIV